MRRSETAFDRLCRARELMLADCAVVFATPPTAMGPVTLALFSDTCGNLIQLYQPPR